MVDPDYYATAVEPLTAGRRSLEKAIRCLDEALKPPDATQPMSDESLERARSNTATALEEVKSILDQIRVAQSAERSGR